MRSASHMKRGDVFTVPGNSQLYIMETTTMGGSIYALRFDLALGGYGDSIVFDQDTEFVVQFNRLKPEQPQEGWQYCQIRIQVNSRDPWSGTECFVAEVLTEADKQIIASSKNTSFIRGDTILHNRLPKHRQIHQDLVQQLLDQGWEEILEKRKFWYSIQFKRPQ